MGRGNSFLEKFSPLSCLWWVPPSAAACTWPIEVWALTLHELHSHDSAELTDFTPHLPFHSPAYWKQNLYSYSFPLSKNQFSIYCNWTYIFITPRNYICQGCHWLIQWILFSPYLIRTLFSSCHCSPTPAWQKFPVCFQDLFSPSW